MLSDLFKFKVGDRVKLAYDSPGGPMRGDIVTIKDIKYSIDGPSYYYGDKSNEYFTVNSPQSHDAMLISRKENMFKFRVGDQVKLVYETDEYKAYDVVTIGSILETNSGSWYCSDYGYKLFKVGSNSEMMTTLVSSSETSSIIKETKSLIIHEGVYGSIVVVQSIHEGTEYAYFKLNHSCFSKEEIKQMIEVLEQIASIME